MCSSDLSAGKENVRTNFPPAYGVDSGPAIVISHSFILDSSGREISQLSGGDFSIDANSYGSEEEAKSVVGDNS